MQNNIKSVNAQDNSHESILNCYLSKPKGHLENTGKDRQSSSWAIHSRPPNYKAGDAKLKLSAITFGLR
jgi:hypothetical protein